MKAIITKGRILPEYFINFVRGCESDLLAQWSKQGATVESIEYQYLSNSLIPIPTIKEQQEIIQFVKDKTRNLSSNISIAYKVIRILQEYRNNIISHLVTGKINVFELSELLTKNNISGERFEEELTEYEFLGEDSSEEVEVE